MADMIFEYILHPIIEASGGEVSGIEIVLKVVLFLTFLFTIMYGVPALMLALL